MEPPPKPHDELERLTTLYALDVLDTLPSEPVERVVRMARRIFQVPTALVTFIDDERQWVMSGLGEPCDLDRSTSFCGYAILGPDVMTVPDAKADPRFSDNPFVAADASLRFYAGAPLTLGGRRIGTICLFDNEPRDLSEDEREILRDLASTVESELLAGYLAVVDELTGLYNRRGFVRICDQLLHLAERHGEPVTLFTLDLDGLKAVNDQHGHAAGDAVLKAAANRLRAAFRASDTIARVGGDEFNVLCYGPCDAEAVAARVGAPGLRSAQEPTVPRFSVGHVTSVAGTPRSVTALLPVADARMYADKAAHRRAAAAP
jgi:diguanylate cyclase (GGDEF)-like protein